MGGIREQGDTEGRFVVVTFFSNLFKFLFVGARTLKLTLIYERRRETEGGMEGEGGGEVGE